MRKFLALFFTAAWICLSCPWAFASSEGNGPGFEAYTLKGGHVYRGDEKLRCEVHDVPENTANGIKAWAVIGAGSSDSVTEADTGVWFFGGGAVMFIPLDSEHECQDLIWSPAGDRLVLVRGSGVRPDVFYELYTLPDEGAGDAGPFNKEKEAGFSGMLGEVSWLEDGMRFAFTRIDDARRGEPADNPHWLRLSAVLHDSAVGETIALKESTDTQNFRFGSVSPDGGDIVLSEEYVESPEDWGDEDKVKTREISVPVPAAG
jgi:hypothetical protein